MFAGLVADDAPFALTLDNTTAFRALTLGLYNESGSIHEGSDLLGGDPFQADATSGVCNEGC